MDNYFDHNIIPEQIIKKLPTNFFILLNEYLKLLFKWNEKINLIARNEIKNIMNRHIIDSLQLILFINIDHLVIDIGSGAGLPGMILSLAGIKNMILVESNKKKSSFLLEASLISTNKITILNERIEEIKDLKADIIVARAFSTIDNIINITRDLRKNNTEYILLKGKKGLEELEEFEKYFECSTWNVPSITDENGKIIFIKNILEK